MSRLDLSGLALAACVAIAAGPALAAQPIPLQAGTYCGAKDARVVIDAAHDLVQIDGYRCAFPIIAADVMQSQACSRPDTTTGKQMFDMRVVGRDFIHAGSWYRLCGPVPAGGAEPNPSSPPNPGG